MPVKEAAHASAADRAALNEPGLYCGRPPLLLKLCGATVSSAFRSHVLGGLCGQQNRSRAW